MNKFKTGSEIKNYGDVTALILTIINCSKEFNESYLTNTTLYHLNGCDLEFSKTQIYRMVSDVIETMNKHGFLQCSNGVYTKNLAYFSLDDYYSHKQAESIIL